MHFLHSSQNGGANPALQGQVPSTGLHSVHLEAHCWLQPKPKVPAGHAEIQHAVFFFSGSLVAFSVKGSANENSL